LRGPGRRRLKTLRPGSSRAGAARILRAALFLPARRSGATKAPCGQDRVRSAGPSTSPTHRPSAGETGDRLRREPDRFAPRPTARSGPPGGKSIRSRDHSRLPRHIPLPAQARRFLRKAKSFAALLYHGVSTDVFGVCRGRGRTVAVDVTPQEFLERPPRLEAMKRAVILSLSGRSISAKNEARFANPTHVSHSILPLRQGFACKYSALPAEVASVKLRRRFSQMGDHR
jgi:hypothetical protein